VSKEPKQLCKSIAKLKPGLGEMMGWVWSRYFSTKWRKL